MMRLPGKRYRSVSYPVTIAGSGVQAHPQVIGNVVAVVFGVASPAGLVASEFTCIVNLKDSSTAAVTSDENYVVLQHGIQIWGYWANASLSYYNTGVGGNLTFLVEL